MIADKNKKCAECAKNMPKFMCSRCNQEFFCDILCQSKKETKHVCIPHGNIEIETIENQAYRRVLWTTANIQVVLMNIPVGDDIESEIHKENDQFFRVEKGSIKVIIEDHTHLDGTDGFSFIVPKGTKHRIINTGINDLKLYTIYSPPHHEPNKINFVHT